MAIRINHILLLVQENEKYMFVLLDVVSLLKNVPLRKTLNIILKRAYNTFENSVLHLHDIEICPNRLGIYDNHTQTDKYVHIISYTLLIWKTSWIYSLVVRAKKICSLNYFNKETQLIKKDAP